MSAIKLVRRGSSAAAAPPVTGGLPFYGTWPGASGSWPIPWQSVVVGSDPSIVQNSGVGSMSRTANSFAAMYPQTAATNDVDVLVRLSHAASIHTSHGGRFGILLRWAGGTGIGSTNLEPTSCLELEYRYRGGTTGNQIRHATVFLRDINGVGTNLFSHSLQGNDHWFRVKLVGNTFRLKVWSASDMEPLDWIYEDSNINHTSSGYTAVTYGNINHSTYTQFNIHSFALTAPV